MKRVVLAVLIGGAFVGVVEVLGYRGVATPVPFNLLIIGILAGAHAPDTGFNPEGDLHPWGLVSTSIMYAVNIAIYSLLAYLILWVIGSARRLQK
jgi:hypothetical protein